jgi:hypothetical protein
MPLNIKPRDACRWDLVSLGEVMLRFDPGDYRIWTTRHFAVSEGGGEYNVARGLKRCFGLETAIVTSFESPRLNCWKSYSQAAAFQSRPSALGSVLNYRSIRD